MICSTYKSPIGNLLLASKNKKLIGLWIENQKYYLSNLKEEIIINDKEEVLVKTKQWLDQYFEGKKPNIEELDIEPIGSDFRKQVWKLLIQIPYGTVVTYKDIAQDIAKQKGLKQMSTQAIGNAVGHNPISIIIPCHRVIGTNGNLIGYAAGIDKKRFLLKHENENIKKE